MRTKGGAAPLLVALLLSLALARTSSTTATTPPTTDDDSDAPPFPTFYFYLRPFESDRRAAYQHPMVSLGEGLCALVRSASVAAVSDCWWPSNVDYWPTQPSRAEPQYLFRRQSLREVAASAAANASSSSSSSSSSLSPSGADESGLAHLVVVVSALTDLRLLPPKLLAPREMRRGRVSVHDLSVPGDVAAAAKDAAGGAKSALARASTVFVDWRDGVYFNPVASANFDLYFKAHFAKYVRSFNASGNVRVGSFYLTNRILSAARAAREDAADAAATETVLFPHGGARLNLDVRSFAWNEFYAASFEEGFVAADHDGSARWSGEDGSGHFWWEVTGHRHNPGFFRRLAHYAACDCSGGYFYDQDTSETITGAALTAEALAGRDEGSGAPSKRSIGLFQWESFKLWESFAVGCAVIMPELERYGLELPIMPTPWEHYVPLRLDNKSSLDGLSARLQTMPRSELRAIGDRGRSWALDNYCPECWARRLIRELRSSIIPESKPNRKDHRTTSNSRGHFDRLSPGGDL